MIRNARCRRGQTQSLRGYATNHTGTTVDPQIPDQRCCISEIVGVVPAATHAAQQTPYTGCSVCNAANCAIWMAETTFLRLGKLVEQVSGPLCFYAPRSDGLPRCLQ